jgi:hypothetical protein
VQEVLAVAWMQNGRLLPTQIACISPGRVLLQDAEETVRRAMAQAHQILSMDPSELAATSAQVEDNAQGAGRYMAMRMPRDQQVTKAPAELAAEFAVVGPHFLVQGHACGIPVDAAVHQDAVRRRLPGYEEEQLDVVEEVFAEHSSLDGHEERCQAHTAAQASPQSASQPDRPLEQTGRSDEGQLETSDCIATQSAERHQAATAIVTAAWWRAQELLAERAAGASAAPEAYVDSVGPEQTFPNAHADADADCGDNVAGAERSDLGSFQRAHVQGSAVLAMMEGALRPRAPGGAARGLGGQLRLHA